jgi:hypothetical protein
MRDLSCTPKIHICFMDETKIPSIYASREDPESESRISRDSILLFFLSEFIMDAFHIHGNCTPLEMQRLNVSHMHLDKVPLRQRSCALLDFLLPWANSVHSYRLRWFYESSPLWRLTDSPSSLISLFMMMMMMAG